MESRSPIYLFLRHFVSNLVGSISSLFYYPTMHAFNKFCRESND